MGKARNTDRVSDRFDHNQPSSSPPPTHNVRTRTKPLPRQGRFWLALCVDLTAEILGMGVSVWRWGPLNQQTGGFEGGHEDHTTACADDRRVRIKGLGERSQKAHIRAVRYLAELLGRSPDTVTVEDLRAWQLHMVDTNVTPSTQERAAGWAAVLFRDDLQAL